MNTKSNCKIKRRQTGKRAKHRKISPQISRKSIPMNSTWGGDNAWIDRRKKIDKTVKNSNTKLVTWTTWSNDGENKYEEGKNEAKATKAAADINLWQTFLCLYERLVNALTWKWSAHTKKCSVTGEVQQKIRRRNRLNWSLSLISNLKNAKTHLQTHKLGRPPMSANKLKWFRS